MVLRSEPESKGNAGKEKVPGAAVCKKGHAECSGS